MEEVVEWRPTLGVVYAPDLDDGDG